MGVEPFGHRTQRNREQGVNMTAKQRLIAMWHPMISHHGVAGWKVEKAANTPVARMLAGTISHRGPILS